MGASLVDSTNLIPSGIDEKSDYVSFAVDRFLEPFTECASVSDERNRYYT